MITPQFVHLLLIERLTECSSIHYQLPAVCGELTQQAEHCKRTISGLERLNINPKHIHIQPGFIPVIEVGEEFLSEHADLRYLYNFECDDSVSASYCDRETPFGFNTQHLQIFLGLMNNCRIVIKKNVT
jgi:hypothetical protein